MNHRERVLAALEHRTPDRTPTDLGGSRTSSIHVQAYSKLAAKLGVAAPAPEIIDVMQQVVAVDPRIKDLLDVDIETVNPDTPTSFGNGSGERRYTDEWGVVRRMPEGGYWFDLEKSPLSGPIDAADIARHPWPDPSDPSRYDGLREKVRGLRDSSDRAICLGLRGSVVHISQFMRGFEDWYYDMALNPDLVAGLMDAILDVALPIIDRTLELTGDLIDIAFIGDDLGHQRGSQISPSAYRKVIKPRHARVFEAIRKGAPNAYIALHSCGSVVELIDDLIEIGVQVLNPVQVSAAGMDPRELKRRWGDRLTFWGGIDTQRVLPFGSPEGVRAEVRERVRVLGEGGGYICAAVHNIQAEVPVENIVALFEEGRKAEAVASVAR